MGSGYLLYSSQYIFWLIKKNYRRTILVHHMKEFIYTLYHIHIRGGCHMNIVYMKSLNNIILKLLYLNMFLVNIPIGVSLVNLFIYIFFRILLNLFK